MRCSIRLIGSVIIIIILVSIGAIYAADLKDGFMGTMWKTDLSASPDFVKIDEQDQISNRNTDSFKRSHYPLIYGFQIDD